MNERIKQLRAALGMNQRDFSQKAKIGHSTLAMFETGQRVPKDIHIAQICQAFNVNEQWLRTGSGEMFNIDNTIITQLSDEYDLDGFERAMIEGFLKMRPDERKVIKSYVRNFLDKLMTDEEAYRDYREEYIADRALPFAARGGDTSNLQEAADLYDSAPPDDEQSGE